MPFSGGSFSLFAGSNPVVTGTTIASAWANSTLSDLATGLSTCVLKDGTQTITANIPMSSFKLTGLAAGSAAGDSARYEQLGAAAQPFTTLTSVAGTNTITGTATPTPAYAVGQRYTFVPAVTNTGATTLNISSLGAGAVQLLGGALTGGELQAGLPVTVLVTAATPVFEIIQPTQFTDARALVVGATDATKKIRFEVDGLTTATTRVITVPDASFTLPAGAASAATTLTGTDVTQFLTAGGFAGNKSLSTTAGYYRFPGGFIVQWVNNVACNTGGGTDVTFPIAFPTACVAVSIAPNDGTLTTELGATTVNTTKVTVTNNGGTNVTPYVIAIGY